MRAIKADGARFHALPDALARLVPMFCEMIDTTPALRAAALEVHDRLARVIRDELATQLGVDPADVEPTVASRALVGLVEVAMHSRVRHILGGLRGAALQHAVADDLERGARLLQTGLAREAKARRRPRP